MKQLERVSVPNKGRHYVLPDKRVVPSVTNVLGIIAKPALVHWSANLEREYVVEKAADLYRDTTRQSLSRTKWEAELRSDLGKQKAHQLALRQAGDIGSYVHDRIQHELKGRMGKFEPEPKPTKLTEKDIEAADIAYMAWEDWAKSVELTPLKIEETVYNQWSAGTIDLLGELTITQDLLRDTPVGIIEASELMIGDRMTAAFDWKSNKPSKSQPNGIYKEARIQVCTYAQMLVEADEAPADTLGIIVRIPKTLDDPMFQPGGSGKVDVRVAFKEERIKLADTYANALALWEDMNNGVSE